MILNFGRGLKERPLKQERNGESLAPTAWNVSVTQLDEPFKTLYSILKSVEPTINGRVEIILIGGAAMLLAETRHRVTDDIDILSSSPGIEQLKSAIRHPLQIVSEGFLCLHPDYRQDC